MAESRHAANDDSHRVVAALVDLFDKLPPDDVFAAQQELQDRSIDPDRVEARIKGTTELHLQTGGMRRSSPQPRRERRARRPAASRRRWWVAAAALAACALAAIQIARQTDPSQPPERLARAIAPRARIALPRQAVTDDPVSGAASEARGDRGEPVAAVGDIRHVDRVVDSAAPPATTDTANEEGSRSEPRVDPRPVAATDTTGPTAMDESWILDSGNWQSAQDLLPEPVLRRVRSGDYWYEVEPIDGETFRANYPARFWKQSRDNAGRYNIDPTTCGLVDTATQTVAAHLEGFPFPTVERRSPQAACRIVWNMRAADALAGNRRSAFAIEGFDRRGITRRLKLTSHEAYFLRQPVANPENLRRAVMTELVEPLDVDGVAGLSKSVNDWTTPDKLWFFIPATRRVRRVGAAVRSDPIADFPLYSEDFGGFASKIESYRWELVGEGQVLAAVSARAPLPLRHADNGFAVTAPVIRTAAETPRSEGVAWHVVEGVRLTPRPVWIVEARSQDPSYNFSKVVLYIDKEMYRIYWKVVFSRAGEYFYNAMFNYYWARDEEGDAAAVIPSFVLGVDDARERAAIAGRAQTDFVDVPQRPDIFTMRALTAMSD